MDANKIHITRPMHHVNLSRELIECILAEWVEAQTGREVHAVSLGESYRDSCAYLKDEEPKNAAP